MNRFHDVRLQLVRPGPQHNQLLSPLTQYLALCGDGSPITFSIPHEHRRFLNRLDRLRYVTIQDQALVPVAHQLREATVVEVGQDVSGILASIPSLLAEISGARGAARQAGKSGSGDDFVHLRLVLGGSELAMVPFEFAFSPQSYPNEGREFFLQLEMAVTLTREVPLGRPRRLDWDGTTEPRILVIAAQPAGLDVPLEGHLHAIRRAMEPWIGWPKADSAGATGDTAKARLPEVKKRIRVLPNASLEAIYRTCAEETFSHVHILAHGVEHRAAGEQSFGLALCEDGDPARMRIATGSQLAKALQAERAGAAGRCSPTFVTLCTCDSGNPGSVLVPGGSIAHDLHSEGIPWVFASQFPLTKAGSVRLADALYPGLFRGDDPRQVLYEVRRRLFLGAKGDHDWGSIVAYATTGPDFEAHVASWFEAQSKRAIEVGLARFHALNEDEDAKEKQGILDRVRAILDHWQRRVPNGDSSQERARRAEYHGIRGSTFKRIALMHHDDRTAFEKHMREALASYRSAMNAAAMDEKFHWTGTQALSLAMILAEKPDRETYDLVVQVARHALKDPGLASRAWAHGTLAELEMLAVHHKAAGKDAKRIEAIRRSVIEHCRTIVDLMGAESFQVESTRRQFNRYASEWSANDDVKEIARTAVAALDGKADPESA